MMHATCSLAQRVFSQLRQSGRLGEEILST